MRRLALATVISVTLFGSIVSGQEAPLGLTWATTSDSVRQQGVELRESNPDAFGIGFSATKLSKALADQEMTYLSFGHNDKLWRMVVVSKEFANDPMGIAVRNRYDELLTILSEKYGKPKSLHSLGDSIYAQSQYFLAGIEGGKSFWYSNFSTADLAVQIGIVGQSSSQARWRIIYEYKPLKAVFEQSKRGKEKGAL